MVEIHWEGEERKHVLKRNVSEITNKHKHAAVLTPHQCYCLGHWQRWWRHDSLSLYDWVELILELVWELDRNLNRLLGTFIS